MIGVHTVQIQSIPTHNGPLSEAWEQSLGQGSPSFVPTHIYADDRGWSLMNQFQNILCQEGQVNYSVMYPNVVKAWHRHRHQTDFWLCLHGHLKVGIYRESDDVAWQGVTGEKRPGVVIIPPPLWHGVSTVGIEPAGLLYYVTRQYNPSEPDEERRVHDSVVGFRWGVEHR